MLFLLKDCVNTCFLRCYINKIIIISSSITDNSFVFHALGVIEEDLLQDL